MTTTPPPKILVLTLLAMIAFASNSLLCRAALKDTRIDAATFTTVRILAGALMLFLIVRARDRAPVAAGSWPSAFALFAYAAGFSYAYISLSAGTGALLLFGAVQATMIGYGIWAGERPRPAQVAGIALALGGLVGLLLPGISAPPPLGAALMIAAGIAWGIYSLRGRGAGDATRVTAGNFLRCVPLAAALSLATIPFISMDAWRVFYAILSGAIASGVGYAIWYTALRGLTPASAATVQLSVPLLAAMGGFVFLREVLTLRLLLAGLAILGGIALVIFVRPSPQPSPKGDAERRVR